MSLGAYLSDVESHIKYKDGPALAPLLSINGPQVAMLRSECAKKRNWADTVRQYVGLHQYWEDMVKNYISCLCARTILEQYTAMEQMVRSLVDFFSNDQNDRPDQGWATSVLRVVLKEYRFVATQADAGTGATKYVAQAVTMISKLLARACSDPKGDPTARGQAALTVANNLFRLYMQTNLGLADQTRTRVFQNFNDATIRSTFPSSEVVSFSYLVGYQLAYKGDYAGAAEYLEYAFQHCLAGCVKNKRLILLYLVPLKLLQGTAPSIALLRKYQLHQYVDIVTALKQGNVDLLNRSLALHELFFERRGLYLLLEKLKIIAYRNLFRKVFVIFKKRCELSTEEPKPNWSRLPLSMLNRIMITMVEMDTDEMECILANLVHKGFIKGYISHLHQILVLLKSGDPFPSVRSINK